MKKILLILLSFSAILLLTACGEIKYELKDGTMYANRKEATGTFEFILNGYKTKGKYINGLPDGLFERYYPDGSIFIKDEFKDGTLIKEEIFYKSGETLATATDGKYLKLFDKDGRLVESYDADKDKNIINLHILLEKAKNKMFLYVYHFLEYQYFYSIFHYIFLDIFYYIIFVKLQKNLFFEFFVMFDL